MQYLRFISILCLQNKVFSHFKAHLLISYMLLVVHRLRNAVIPPWFKDSRSRDMLVNHLHSFSKTPHAISKLKLKPFQKLQAT